MLQNQSGQIGIGAYDRITEEFLADLLRQVDDANDAVAIFLLDDIDAGTAMATPADQDDVRSTHSFTLLGRFTTRW